MLNEYALRFYAFLEQSLKLDALEWRESAMAASVAYMDEGNRDQIMKSYESQSHDIIEDIRDARNANGEGLGELLNGS